MCQEMFHFQLEENSTFRLYLPGNTSKIMACQFIVLRFLLKEADFQTTGHFVVMPFLSK